MNSKNLQGNKPNNKVNVLLPAIVFLGINIIVQFFQLTQSLDALSLLGFLVSIFFSNLISQSLAYLTCRFIVIKRGKGQREVWINYIVWILLTNLGIVSELLSQ